MKIGSTKYNSFLCSSFDYGLLFFFGCENTQKEIDEWTKDKVMQEEAINIESYISQEGKMKAKLTAPLMLRVMARYAIC